MPTTVELKEQRRTLWERMKALNDLSEAENRDLTEEERGNWNKAEADMQALEGRISRQEILERSPAPVGDPERVRFDARQGNQEAQRTDLLTTQEYTDAFRHYVRRGFRGMRDETRDVLERGFVASEQRATMAVASGVTGGFLVPDEPMRALEQAMLYYGGMRQVATIIPTESGADLPIPTSDDTGNVGRILAENAAVTQTDVTVGQRVLKAYMYSSDEIMASLQFLQDAAIDVDSWLGRLIGERIGRITNTHFTTGSGASEPEGILQRTTQGKAGDTGSTTSITWDELIDLEQSIDPAYIGQGCRYMFRNATLTVLRKLKDGEGRYLWQPGQPTGGGPPATINSFPYVINQDVPAMAASANSIVFGLLSKYLIRDVRGVTVLRLDERHAENLRVAWFGFSRHDGLLIDAGTNPVKHYTNAAS